MFLYLTPPVILVTWSTVEQNSSPGRKEKWHSGVTKTDMAINIVHRTRSGEKTSQVGALSQEESLWKEVNRTLKCNNFYKCPFKLPGLCQSKGMGGLWLVSGQRVFSIVHISGGNIQSTEDRKYIRTASLPRFCFPTHRSSVLRQVGTRSTGRATLQVLQGSRVYLRVWDALQDLLLLSFKVLSLFPSSDTSVLRRLKIRDWIFVDWSF